MKESQQQIRKNEMDLFKMSLVCWLKMFVLRRKDYLIKPISQRLTDFFNFLLKNASKSSF